MGVQGTQNGPGYSEVADYLMELSRTWNGLHTFTVGADRDRRGIPCLFVVLKHSPNVRDSGGKGEVRTWSNWPCSANRTFASLMFRLCFELDAKLGRQKIERESQTAF